MKTQTCVFVMLLLTLVNSKSLSKKQQINDPAKARTLKDCENWNLTLDHKFCCDLIVNDQYNTKKQVCVDLKEKGNLEPMATVRGYPNGRCKLDRQKRLYCKGSGNMDPTVGQWHLDTFIRVLNPREKDRSLEACKVGSNFSVCW